MTIFIIDVNKKIYTIRVQQECDLSTIVSCSNRLKLGQNISMFWVGCFIKTYRGVNIWSNYKNNIWPPILEVDCRYESNIGPLNFSPNLYWHLSSTRKCEEDRISYSMFQLFEHFANHLGQTKVHVKPITWLMYHH